MNQRQNDFDCGHAQFVVAGPIRWRYSTDRGKARLALRSQVRVEDVDFGDNYFFIVLPPPSYVYIHKALFWSLNMYKWNHLIGIVFFCLILVFGNHSFTVS